MQQRYFHNNRFKAWINEDIFHIIYYTDELTVELAQEALNVRLKISNGMPFPMLADIRSIKKIDPETRKLAASVDYNQQLLAGALIVGNQFHKVVGNFFLLIDKPPVHGKLFTSEKEALAWLQQFKVVRSTG